ncbi:hypothetical protein LEMLEM_LOCUS1987 [Lemmus lemmus]
MPHTQKKAIKAIASTGSLWHFAQVIQPQRGHDPRVENQCFSRKGSTVPWYRSESLARSQKGDGEKTSRETI